MAVREITSYAALQAIIQSPESTVIDFTAGWTGPCRPMFSVFEEISHTTTEKSFYRMDVRKLSDEQLAGLGIVAMPTFIVFRDGKKLRDLVGGSPRLLEEFVRDVQ
ncbi:hypothetical protein ETB97_001817 [Aspergillus alliaceus]|uniref:Thioredoxin-like protein n=1 Tax=Petromyces alliaceus TaxID=209559 RepID=A0A5N7BZ80_PETAA|nr:thioredoxin-like protein [Aspergillus alliaceus]KAB8234804.1 thioredoxin-like protein [Aspergillus alliaceus]KAE8387136.1 thioredoxin-like protein [Aspergillus alliaceus]KAF5860228.1 hypothetical protein ETB97_001817 [Aspergillus burnettii]